MRTHDAPESSARPPEAWEPLVRLARLAARPLERFLRIQAASGILLLVTAAVALVWATLDHESYEGFWHTPVGVTVGRFTLAHDLEWVVNDVLMVVFFFVVGLEIRREIHHGELSEVRRAVLPAAAALGGMIAPALLYTLVAGGAENLRAGWGIPMATDIAFAVGVLALLGPRVPPALRVILLALAVIDDLGAIVVIAVFYSSDVALAGLGVAALGVLAVFVMQWLGVRTKLLYLLPGIVVWAGIEAAGIHPTIAGVIVGLVTPVRAWLGHDGLVRGLRRELDAIASPKLPPEELAAHLHELDAARREAISPAESLIEALHPWVAFGIMPVFALANAGVELGGGFDASSTTLALAVGVGLCVGKPLGILVACGLVLRLGAASLPAGLGFRHLLVLGVVAGIGFTMSIFIADLAFGGAPELEPAKLAVLLGSLVAGVIALVLGRLLLPVPAAPAKAVAASADEAEASTAS